MLPKKLRESLSARIFCLTFLLFLGACGLTFGLVAWAAPLSYTAVANSELQQKTDALAETLSQTSLDGCAPVLDDFIRSAGAEVVLLDAEGNAVPTGAQLMSQSVYEDDTTQISITADTQSVGMAIAADVEVSLANTAAAQVTFADAPEPYTLCATSFVQAENQVAAAIKRMIPWLLLAVLLFSLFCAWLYARAVARPIVRLSGIAAQMAGLDFHWECAERRRDEIGALGRSLNQMACKLSAALRELEAANQALRGEVERERELDRQRTAFFSAASHELKTPVTILKGQLAGMLEGVDVYQDRDKYLLRSLQVAGRMENLIGEMLAISRMQSRTAGIRREPVDLPALLARQLALYAELFEQRGQRLTAALTPGVTVTGDASLLGKAAGNLLSNAALYSPEGAHIRVWCGMREGYPAVTVENTGAHISERALPHLFEAFCREEGSRSRRTGGSGLGLYLTRMILERHGASCALENTADGVRATVLFGGAPQPARPSS